MTLRNMQLKPLGNARKRYAIFVIAVGLSTFFLPMVILDSPVLGRTQWRPLDIAHSVFQGSLPVAKGQFDEGLVEIGLLYLLLTVARTLAAAETLS